MNWKLIHTIHRTKHYISPQTLSKEIKRCLRPLGKISGLTNVNFSFTSLCSADCIFCPLTRGLPVSKSFMPIESVEKIIKDTNTSSFKKYHNIRVVSVCENGDIFLHKNSIDILRLVRRRMPGVKIQCYINFRLFTQEKIDVVLKENLIDFVGCNIDGSNSDNYFRVKNSDFNIATKHLFYFLAQRRKKWKSIPVSLSVLTFHDYVRGIFHNLGVMPLKLKELSIEPDKLENDFLETAALFEKALDHPKDKIMRSIPIGWAERNQIDTSKVDYKKFHCPQLERISKEAFISPDGNWYACCWDSNNELVLGNVISGSFNDIFFSQRRMDLIESLKAQKFKEIGGPCATVNCCQKLPIPANKLKQ